MADKLSTGNSSHNAPHTRHGADSASSPTFQAANRYVQLDTLAVRYCFSAQVDRLTGGTAGGAKYDLEVLTRGEFGTTLETRNFERWQLGLVGLVLRDMEQGLVRLGFGKSRGLGRFRVEITKFEIAYYNQDVSHLSGMSKLCSDNERAAYGFFPETENSDSALPEPQVNGLRRAYIVTDTWKETLSPAVNDLIAFIERVDWPQCLEDFLKGRG